MDVDWNPPSGFTEALCLGKSTLWKADPPIQVVFHTVNTRMLEEGAGYARDARP
jgi:hypothetical protein